MKKNILISFLVFASPMTAMDNQKMVTELNYAIRNGDLAIFNKIIAQGVKINTPVIEDDITPIYEAATQLYLIPREHSQKHLYMTEKLLRIGADLRNVPIFFKDDSQFKEIYEKVKTDFRHQIESGNFDFHPDLKNILKWYELEDFYKQTKKKYTDQIAQTCSVPTVIAKLIGDYL